MRRLVGWILAASVCTSGLALPRASSATPFADVPADHWAEAYVRALAADGVIDGYPGGGFKGDRPLTRYEMAVLVARALAKLQAGGPGAVPGPPFDPSVFATRNDLNALDRNVARSASKTDLDKLQKLVLALKDELDALGVRVAAVEDALDGLDRRTKLAQGLQFHGTIVDDNTARRRTTLPRSIVNTTGAAVTTSYGATIAPGASGGVDPLFGVFVATEADNNPVGSQGPGTSIRYDDRLALSYALSDTLTVSIPLRLLNTGTYGGDFDQTQKVGIVPDLVVKLSHAGGLTNLSFHDGTLDDLSSSRLGLAYRAPDASQQNTFNLPFQPFPHGFSLGATIGGLTDVQISFSRVDQVLLNTLTSVLDPSQDLGPNTYFQPVIRPQASYVQTGSAPASDAFVAGSGGLSAVYLRKKAVAGSVSIASLTLASGLAAPPPSFSYVDALNLIVFATPVPAGATVTIAYTGLGTTDNAQYQRYQANVRVNHKIARLPGGEIGLSFNRIYDDDQLLIAGDRSTYQTAPPGSPSGTGFGEVSDTVFGIDGQIPIRLLRAAGGEGPQLAFAEVAFTRATFDYRNVAPTGAAAAVAGLRLRFRGGSATLQYQDVGANFVAGAPLRFFGNAPPAWQNYAGVALPEFFGFADNLAVNAAFDASVNAVRPGTSNAAGNPNLTFVYPIWNPFEASGPGWFGQYAPNEQGPSLALNAPLRLGAVRFATRLYAAHLQELQANAGATATFGALPATSVRATFDALSGGASVTLPVARLPVTLSFTAGVDRLRRLDRTTISYTPYDPATGAVDAASLAARTAAGVAGPAAAPNYLDVRRLKLGANASVPVTTGVVAGAGYSTQQYAGSAGTSLATNVSERKDQVDLSLSYSVPRTSSTVGLNFRTNTYHDAVVPNADFSQNREDLTFTIRF